MEASSKVRKRVLEGEIKLVGGRCPECNGRHVWTTQRGIIIAWKATKEDFAALGKWKKWWSG